MNDAPLKFPSPKAAKTSDRFAVKYALCRRERGGHGYSTYTRHVVFDVAGSSRCGLPYPGIEWQSDSPATQGEIRGCSKCGTSGGQASGRPLFNVEGF